MKLIADQSVANVASILDAILTRCPPSRRGVVGTLPCPSCGKLIQFARTREGGAIRASCGTPTCFSVVE